MSFKLGDLVKDKHSDFKGILTIQSTSFNGNRRWGISGAVDNKPETYFMDEVQFELVQAAEKNITPVPTKYFGLGDEVKDKASGWKAIVVGLYLYANGCVRYEVQGSNKRTKAPEVILIDEALLELVKPNVIERTTPARTGPIATRQTPSMR